MSCMIPQNAHAIDLPNQRFHEHVKIFQAYAQKEKSDNSLRAYKFGWRKFNTWLDEHGYTLKQDESHVALLVGMFLTDMAQKRLLKYKSLAAYYAAIKHHIYETMRIDLDHPEVKKAMKGVRHELKQPPTKKEGLKAKHVSAVLSSMQASDRLIDLRDRALLLIGFSAALRRSELVGIDLEHITYDPEGISIYIPYSKTDQSGRGHHVEIPKKANTLHCPLNALQVWLKASDINSGPIFRPITKGKIILPQRLSDKSVALIIKKRAYYFFDSKEAIAGHSLRRGFVLTAMEADVPALVIMNQTRHASLSTLKDYAADKKNYKTNALHSIDL